MRLKIKAITKWLQTIGKREIIIVTITSLSCSSYLLTLTVENTTKKKADLYVDSLYIVTLQPMMIDKWSISEAEPGNLLLKSSALGCFNRKKLAPTVDSIRSGVFYYHVFNIEARIEGNTVFRKLWSFRNFENVNDTLIQIDHVFLQN
jgi:hypothetical protein